MGRRGSNTALPIRVRYTAPIVRGVEPPPILHYMSCILIHFIYM
jgi:hypothetical protein